MLTLKAAGLLDLDAGELVRPGILRIDGDRIAGLGGPPLGDIIDVGEVFRLLGETGAQAPLLNDVLLNAAGRPVGGTLPRHVRRALVLDGLLDSARQLTREAGAFLLADRLAPRLIYL